MQRHWAILGLVLLCSTAAAQEHPPAASAPAVGASVPGDLAGVSPVMLTDDCSTGGRFVGNHAFPDFIGFISSPAQNIDPRAVTEIYPLFASFWTKEIGPLPASDFQLYGAGLTVALSDRLAVGLNQGGFADVHLSNTDKQMLITVNQLGQAFVLNLLRTDPAALLTLFRQHGLGVRELLRLQRLVAADPTLKFINVEVGGE